MAAKSRLALFGGSRSPYGSFAGKVDSTPAVSTGMETLQHRMAAMNPACPWWGPLVDASLVGFSRYERAAGLRLYPFVAPRRRIHPHIKPVNPSHLRVNSSDPRVRRSALATSQDQAFQDYGVIEEIENDYLVTLMAGGPNTARVAKPFHLRGGPYLVTIDPDYAVGDQILVGRPVGGTGLEGVPFMDYNNQARSGTRLPGGSADNQHASPGEVNDPIAFVYDGTTALVPVSDQSAGSWQLGGTLGPSNYYEALADVVDLDGGTRRYIYHTNASASTVKVDIADTPVDMVTMLGCQFITRGQDPGGAGAVTFEVRKAGGGDLLLPSTTHTYGGTWSDVTSNLRAINDTTKTAWDGAELWITNTSGGDTGEDVYVTTAYMIIYYSA